jgi:hypothetical protein
VRFENKIKTPMGFYQTEGDGDSTLSEKSANAPINRSGVSGARHKLQKLMSAAFCRKPLRPLGRDFLKINHLFTANLRPKSLWTNSQGGNKVVFMKKDSLQKRPPAHC